MTTFHRSVAICLLAVAILGPWSLLQSIATARVSIPASDNDDADKGKSGENDNEKKDKDEKEKDKDKTNGKEKGKSDGKIRKIVVKVRL